MDKDLEKELRETMIGAMDQHNTELLWERTSEDLGMPTWEELPENVKTQFERINALLIQGIEIGYITAIIDQGKK